MTKNKDPIFCPPFKPVCEILPESRVGNFSIAHFELNEEEVKFAKLRSMMSWSPGEHRFTEVGHYVKLYKHYTADNGDERRTYLMSDTPMERFTNSYFVRITQGDILIAGLGIGMILWPLLHNEKVETIQVIELEQDVIDLVGPTYLKIAEEQGKTLELICDDIFTWSLPDGKKWDRIWLDIWPEISADFYPEMKRLHRRFARRRNDGGWMGSWRKADMRYHDTGRWRDDYGEGWYKK
jgi:spermidine synthase